MPNSISNHPTLKKIVELVSLHWKIIQKGGNLSFLWFCSADSKFPCFTDLSMRHTAMKRWTTVGHIGSKNDRFDSFVENRLNSAILRLVHR